MYCGPLPDFARPTGVKDCCDVCSSIEQLFEVPYDGVDLSVCKRCAGDLGFSLPPWNTETVVAPSWQSSLEHPPNDALSVRRPVLAPNRVEPETAFLRMVKRAEVRHPPVQQKPFKLVEE